MSQAPRLCLRTLPRPQASVQISRQSPRLSRARYQSSQSSTAQSSTSHTPALLAGAAGGTLALLFGYVWYSLSGAKTLVNTSNQAHAYLQSTFKKTQEASPKPSEALQWLRETANSYTKFIPGASHYVDTAFDDLEKVQRRHNDEVEKIVTEAKDQLKDVTSKKVTFERVPEVWTILANAMKRIGALAGDAADDILDNHPQLRDQVGGKMDQLKHMGNQYGPEAKQIVDSTWSDLQKILSGGIGASTVPKVQELIRSKTKELQKYGELTWEKGLEQVQPMLDKRPEMKEYVNKNKEALLKGDLGQLWEKVRGGKTEDVKDFVNEQAQKVKEQSQQGGRSGGLQQILDMFPGGSDVMGKLNELSELSQKYGKDAEQLMTSAMQDVENVLQQKAEEGKKLKERVDAEAKNK